MGFPAEKRCKWQINPKEKKSKLLLLTKGLTLDTRDQNEQDLRKTAVPDLPDTVLVWYICRGSDKLRLPTPVMTWCCEVDLWLCCQCGSTLAIVFMPVDICVVCSWAFFGVVAIMGATGWTGLLTVLSAVRRWSVTLWAQTSRDERSNERTW